MLSEAGQEDVDVMNLLLMQMKNTDETNAIRAKMRLKRAFNKESVTSRNTRFAGSTHSLVHNLAMKVHKGHGDVEMVAAGAKEPSDDDLCGQAARDGTEIKSRQEAQNHVKKAGQPKLFSLSPPKSSSFSSFWHKNLSSESGASEGDSMSPETSSNKSFESSASAYEALDSLSDSLKASLGFGTPKRLGSATKRSKTEEFFQKNRKLKNAKIWLPKKTRTTHAEEAEEGRSADLTL